MVFGEPDHIDPERVRQPGFAQCLVDDDAVALRLAAVGEEKIREFHGPALVAAKAA
jgi:hypothetical protein